MKTKLTLQTKSTINYSLKAELFSVQPAPEMTMNKWSREKSVANLLSHAFAMKHKMVKCCLENTHRSCIQIIFLISLQLYMLVCIYFTKRFFVRRTLTLMTQYWVSSTVLKLLINKWITVKFWWQRSFYCHFDAFFLAHLEV